MSVPNTKVSVEFGIRLYGRYKSDGKLSGEAFRDDLLIPMLKRDKHAILDFSGILVTPSVFLEEVFGGIVRTAFKDDSFAKAIGIDEVDLTDPLQIANSINSRVGVIC